MLTATILNGASDFVICWSTTEQTANQFWGYNNEMKNFASQYANEYASCTNNVYYIVLHLNAPQDNNFLSTCWKCSPKEKEFSIRAKNKEKDAYNSPVFVSISTKSSLFLTLPFYLMMIFIQISYSSARNHFACVRANLCVFSCRNRHAAFWWKTNSAVTRLISISRVLHSFFSIALQILDFVLTNERETLNVKVQSRRARMRERLCTNLECFEFDIHNKIVLNKFAT